MSDTKRRGVSAVGGIPAPAVRGILKYGRGFMRPVENNKIRGSLIVEASLTFPVFICFFLLLIFFIKLAYVDISLDHAVNETAKQLAASCYPIAFLNEMEDEQMEYGRKYKIPTFEQELKNAGKYIGSNAQNIISRLITGDMKTSDINDTLGSIAKNTAEDYKNGIRGYIVNTLAGSYFEMKAKAKYMAAKRLMDKFFYAGMPDRSGFEFIMVEIPRGNAEYGLRKTDPGYLKACRKIGYFPDSDDVVVSVEYRTKIPIPFFGGKEITITHTAVERAWLHGSNGIYADDGRSDDGGKPGKDGEKDNQGSDNEDIYKKSEIVYITKTGVKYHRSGCRYLARSSLAIRLDDAVDRGYEPCKVCVTKTAKPFPGRK